MLPALSRHPGVSSIITVVIAVLAVHLTALGNDFHYDDGHSILRNPHIRDLDNLASYFSDPSMYSENPSYAMYRPIVVVSNALNYHIYNSLSQEKYAGGYDPSGYLALNLTIHIVNSLLVLAILSQLILPQSIRVIGSIAFALHPLQTEVVNYVSARSESLVALFYLSAMYGYLRWRSSTSAPAAWLGFSVLMFACALLTKEVAVTLPISLIALEFHIRRKRSADWPGKPIKHTRTTTKGLVILFVTLLIYFVAYQQITGSESISPIKVESSVRSWNSQLATQAKALVYYITGAVFPVRMSVHPQFFESPSIFASVPVVSGLMMASFCLVAWRLRFSAPTLTLGSAWFLIALVPTAIIPLHILVNDHRPYLSLFGFALAFLSLMSRFIHRQVLWALCFVLGLLAHQRDYDWRNELTLWQAAVEDGPMVPEAHFNLGHAHHMTGDLSAAMVAYERAVGLSPQYARAQINLGALYREQGRIAEAKRAFQHALAGEPTSVEALNNLGFTHASQGEHPVAIGLYERALELAPDRAELWVNLGLSLRDAGQRDGAIAALKRAVQLDPQLKDRFPAR